MDSFHAVTGVSIAQLMVLSALVPAFAETYDAEEEHRRIFGRGHSQVVSHSREDYPVISNWLTSPDTPEPSNASAEADDDANYARG